MVHIITVATFTTYYGYSSIGSETLNGDRKRLVEKRLQDLETYHRGIDIERTVMKIVSIR